MNRKTFVLVIFLIAVILVSFVAALYWSKPSVAFPEFYVGIEIAYQNATVSDVRTMVDRVKGYTNVFVIGSVELTYNESALDESCDYIHNAGLKIIVLLTNFTNYSFDSRTWTNKTQQKFGDDFLALYRYDEPGGDQLDNEKLRFVSNTTNYADTASNYTYIMKQHVDFYRGNVTRIVTADYGLYWWDYKAGYDSIFAEFVGNQSRQRHIALCRGASTSFKRDWGAIITWKYDKEPYIEDADSLYNDLVLAYSSGAKYAIVFDYPKIDKYGILTDNHFDALKKFWDWSHANPKAFGSTKATGAYVLPGDYGSGLRSSADNIWGLFPSDELSDKAWNDINTLTNRYGAGFDIVFDDEALGNVNKRYQNVFLWNQTVDFLVGVEVAYPNANANDVKLMVDKVKNYTNLIVIGAPEISLNESALNETCDYISNAGLNFIVLFTDSFLYRTYSPFTWMIEAKQKYGSRFLGVYRYDEPGGNQLDLGVNTLVDSATSYGDAASKYTEYLGAIITYYRNYSAIVTADYALQWFDYDSNYSAVFTEFGSNNTREIAVAESRGGAAAFGADWGAIMTWKYGAAPYIESADELYVDMVDAYKAGAKYVIVFDAPKADIYGIITNDHFNALKRFWTYLQDNPKDFGSQKATVAYVLPKDYGFGLRRADDRIWGLFAADSLSSKVWNDTNKLAKQYGFDLDIIYDEAGVVDSARNRYEQLFFWNETVT